MMEPIKYRNFYIHEYKWGDKDINYCISFNKEKPLIDEDESGIFGLEKYQEILKKFGAKQFKHTYEYEIVHDSYFDIIEQCKKAIDYLVKLIDEFDELHSIKY